MAEKWEGRSVIANLLDLPDPEPEQARVSLPRLGLDLEVRELPYDKLIRIRREQDAQIHLILAAAANHPELRSEAWYHDKMGCATPVDALKKLLRMGEVEKLCRVIDRLNGYGSGSVVELPEEDLDGAALAGAVEELEKN